VFDGGEGSGNFGHAGRPGKVGGSAAEGSGGSGGRRTKENSAPSGHSPSEKARAAKIKEYTGEKDEAKVGKMDEAIRGLTYAYQMDKEKTGLVEEFIRKSPKYDGGVYRGIACTDEEYEGIMSGIKDGATIRASDKDRATSWSSDPAVAAKYSKEKSEWMNSVTFKCEKNESGVPVAYLSAHPSESEVFLSKDATWEVVKVEESTVGDAKKAVVHLKEKPLPKSSETEAGQAENKSEKSAVAKSPKPRYSPSKRPKGIRLPKAEYAMVMEELNTNLTKEELKREFVTKPILNHVYTVRINEFGDYTVIKKAKIADWNKG